MYDAMIDLAGGYDAPTAADQQAEWDDLTEEEQADYEATMVAAYNRDLDAMYAMDRELDNAREEMFEAPYDEVPF